MSVSRSALAIREPQRIALPRGHCGFADLLDHVRHVGERSYDGSRVTLRSSGRLRFSDVVDDAFEVAPILDAREASRFDTRHQLSW